MTESEGWTSKFIKSGKDALSPTNILFKIAMILGFGFLTAFPYLIKNLDNVWNSAINAGITSKGAITILYLKALLSTTWKGLFIGLSTSWDTFINLGSILQNHHYFTLAYSIGVVIVASVIVYQFVSLIFDIIDAKKGKHYPKMLAIVISVGIVLASLPLANFLLGGKTLTSGVIEDSEIESIIDEFTEDQINESINQSETEMPVIDLTGGGT